MRHRRAGPRIPDGGRLAPWALTDRAVEDGGMSGNTTVYDLGEVTLDERSQAGPHSRPVRSRSHFPASAASRKSGWLSNLIVSLSIFLPGAAQILRGRFAVGLFFLTGIGCLAASAWAVVTTMTRLTETLPLLGLPPEPAVWSLAILYGLAALLHVAGVLDAGPRSELGSPHPVLSGLASALVPGWGQVLNGHARRAALFLGGVWLIGAAWLIDSPPAGELLASLRFYLPPEVRLACAPAMRWSALALLWALSVYDAAAGKR
jgi:hypothetical protein